MKFEINEEVVESYSNAVGCPVQVEGHMIVPEPLIVHHVIKQLKLPKVKRSQSTFKQSTYVNERLYIDLFQANDLIEYRVSGQRDVKVVGTIEIE